jgi:O-antigen/teichoic acid export membrane protein
MALRGAANIGTVFFSRQLDFKKMFWVRAARTLLRIVIFIPAIFIFQNVWALALSQIGGALAFLVVSFVSHPYRPRLRWDSAKLKELIRYGKWITAFAMIGFVLTEGDDLFVSLYFGITALGVYQLAFEISNLPTTKITHVLGSIGMPTYARLQRDPEQLRATFIKITRAVMLLTCPLTVLIWTFVPDLVQHIFGMKWAPVIPIVRILVVSGFIRSITATGGPLYQAVGRPDLDFKMNLPRFLVLVAVLWPLSVRWGLTGASLAVVFALAATVPPWAIFIKNLVNVSIKDFFRDNALAFFAAALLALSFVAVRPRFDESALGALAGFVGTLTVWVGSMYVLGRLTRHDLMTEIQRVRVALKRG